MVDSFSLGRTHECCTSESLPTGMAQEYWRFRFINASQNIQWYDLGRNDLAGIVEWLGNTGHPFISHSDPDRQKRREDGIIVIGSRVIGMGHVPPIIVEKC